MYHGMRFLQTLNRVSLIGPVALILAHSLKQNNSFQTESNGLSFPEKLKRFVY